MNGIDEIITRSRTRGGFTQKGAFTLAADKARMKVSEFALPDPFMYCLEYIQSAVALRAVYLDVAVNRSTFILSMCGVHYTRENLVRMFDFLLSTNEDDYARAHRRLAVGTAAALSLPESKVVIESGDGTEAGSCRFEIANVQGDAVVGTPQSPIAGTFIKVTHSSVGSAFDAGALEEPMIIDRCKYLPVTLVLNGEMPFGYAFLRELKFKQYPHHIGFDQGDLYGGLALDDGSRPPSVEGIRILTNGVEISSIPSPFIFGNPPERGDGFHKVGKPLGIKREASFRTVGAVTYDRLHKTASQYEIVQDERMSELRQRLKPFVHQLLVNAGVSKNVRLSYLLDLDATDYSPKGAQYRIDIQQKPFAINGSFAFECASTHASGMRLSVVYEGKGHNLKSIQFLGFEFPIPAIGRIVLKGDCMDALRFLQPGEADFTPERTVVLTPAVIHLIAEAVKSHYHELVKQLTAEGVSWQRQQEKAAKSKKKPASRSTTSDSLVQTVLQIADDVSNSADRTPSSRDEDAALPPFETGVEFEGRPNSNEELSALLERRDTLMRGTGVIPDPTFESKIPTAAPSNIGWALPPINPEVPVARDSTAKRRNHSMPTLEEIRAGLTAPKETRDKLNGICTFLRRILRTDPLCRRFFEQGGKGVTLVDATPQSYCAWVDTTHLKSYDKFNSYVYVNRLHPLINRWIEESHENPMQIFAMALLIRNDIVIQLDTAEQERRFDPIEQSMGTAILEQICRPSQR